MATRLGLLLFFLLFLCDGALAEEQPSLGFKPDPLPPLQLQHLADPDAYPRFECTAEPGPEARGLYPPTDAYPAYDIQELISSPNGAFPDSHETWGGPPEN